MAAAEAAAVTVAVGSTAAVSRAAVVVAAVQGMRSTGWRVSLGRK